MEDFILNKFVLNIEYMFISFLCLLLFFHIPFFWGKNFTKIGWKIIDYIWLITATLSIVSITNNVRLDMSKNWSIDEKDRLEVRYKELEYFFKIDYFCNPAIKTKYSPSNFELIENDRDLTCRWFKNSKELFEKSDFRNNLNYKKIDVNYFKDFPNTETTTYLEYKEYFNTYLKDYNEQFEIYQRTIKYTITSEFEKVLFYLSPFIFILGMALRIVKVTGEILIEKKVE